MGDGLNARQAKHVIEPKTILFVYFSIYLLPITLPFYLSIYVGMEPNVPPPEINLEPADIFLTGKFYFGKKHMIWCHRPGPSISRNIFLVKDIFCML